MVSELVLIRPENPENTGIIARLCANYKCDLKIVDPSFSLNQARKAACSYQEKIDNAKLFDNLEDALDSDKTVIGSSMNSDNPVDKVSVPSQTSLLVGPESDGLTEKDLGFCDLEVRIETPGKPSLNQATATAILLDNLKNVHDSRGLPTDRISALQDITGSSTLTKLLRRSNPSENEVDKILGELK